MAGISGGLQSLHTDSYDEVVSVPTAEAARIAVATQNILREEAHLTDVIDPLGGSYYVEELTDQMQEQIEAVLARIDAARSGEDPIPTPEEHVAAVYAAEAKAGAEDEEDEIEDLLYSLLTRKEVSVGWKDTSVPHLLGYGSLLYVVEQLLMYPSDLLKTRLQVDLRPNSNLSKVLLPVA